MTNWGEDPNKWIIAKRGGFWRVLPPVRTLWGILETHSTFEGSRRGFLQQTRHVKWVPREN